MPNVHQDQYQGRGRGRGRGDWSSFLCARLPTFGSSFS